MSARSSRPRTARPVVLVVLGAALLVAALAPAGASAAPTWLAPQSLTGADLAVATPAVGSDARGAVTVAWFRQTSAGRLVEQATREPGGSFSTTTLQSGAAVTQSLTLAVNTRGDAIVAWQRGGSATTEIWAATRTGAGGAFGPPQVVASVPGRQVYDPYAAINEAGAMMVVWRLADGSATYNETIYGSFRPAGGGFGSPQAISTSDPWNQSPRVALDDSGRATIVWSYWNGGTCGGGDGCADNFARVRVRAPSGTLGTQRDLAGGTPTGRPMFATVDLDAAGNAVAAWSRWTGSVYEVQAATRAAASDAWNNLPSFGQSASASYGDEPQVAVADDGRAVVIWRAADSTIQAASRAPGAGFGAAQTGISAPAALTPSVELDGSGNAIAVWRRTDSEGSRVEAATRPAGGQFGAVKVISTNREVVAPALAVDGRGNALALWAHDDPAAPDATDSTIDYAAYDASPPEVGAISAPATGFAGDPLTMSVPVLDVWSPVTVGWSFGDGQSGAGASVNHAYGAPGTFSLGVTATDAVGNSASAASRSVQVTNKPLPVVVPPPPAPVTTPLLGTTLQYRITASRRHSTIKFLRLRDVRAGSTVRLTCAKGARKGRGCPFKSRTVKFAKAARTADLTRYFNVKRKVKGSRRPRTKVAKIAPGTGIGVDVTAPGYTGRSFTLAIRARRAPKRTIGCLAPGGFTALPCPA